MKNYKNKSYNNDIDKKLNIYVDKNVEKLHKSKYKMIAVDFDGTILTDNRKVLKSTKQALINKKDNYYIVGVTARTLLSVKSVCELEIFDYLILNNGCDIYNVNNKNREILSYIDKKDIIKLQELIKGKYNSIDYCTSDYYYKTKHYLSLYNYIRKYKSLDKIDNVERINIFVNKDYINELCDLINSSFDNLDCFIMQDSNKSKKWLVVLNKGVNKLYGLSKLCDSLNINIDEVVFFGDGPNDIQIIENVGLGVALKNALDEVKNSSVAVTYYDNNHDGVGDYINKNL